MPPVRPPIAAVPPRHGGTTLGKPRINVVTPPPRVNVGHTKPRVNVVTPRPNRGRYVNVVTPKKAAPRPKRRH